MYYVYIIEDKISRSLYIGFTSDLKRRWSEHKNGRGGSTTSKMNDKRLIYYEAYTDKRDAVGREKFLKSGSGRKYINKQLKFHLATKNTS